MSQIYEPFVESRIQAATTTDTSGYQNGKIVVAAPLVSDHGPYGITMINNQRELLRKYRPDGANYLVADLDSTFFHIYAMLAHSSVLVSRVGSSMEEAVTKMYNADQGAFSYTKLFGNKMVVDYKGSIAVGDNGKSYLVDGKDRILDTIAAVKVGAVSVQSLDFQEKISKLINGLEDSSVYLYGYKYGENNELTLYLAYKYHANVNEFIKTTLGLANTDGLPTAPKLTIDDKYRLLLKATAPVGSAITNTTSTPLKFLINSIDPANKRFILKVNSQLDAGSEFTIADVTRTEVKLAPAPVGVSAISNGLKLEGDPQTDEKVLISNPDRVFAFSDPVRAEFEKLGGNAAPVDGERSAKVQRAILDLLEYDEGYRIDFVWDAGEGEVGLQSVMNSVAAELKALALHSVKTTNHSTVDAIVNEYKQSNSFNSYKLAPYMKYNFGIKTLELSPCIEYVEAIVRNKSANSEFAPVFGIVNGQVSVGELVAQFKKTDREKFLAGQINTIKFDKFRGISSINDCRTGEGGQSLFNEEWIVRMANRIGWDLDFLLEQFLGRYDVESTAFDVKATIDYYMKTTIMNQTYAPEKYDVIVDKSNNVWGDGELMVEVNIYVGRALRKITVVSKMLPLSTLTAN